MATLEKYLRSPPGLETQLPELGSDFYIGGLPQPIVSIAESSELPATLHTKIDTDRIIDNGDLASDLEFAVLTSIGTVHHFIAKSELTVDNQTFISGTLAVHDPEYPGDPSNVEVMIRKPDSIQAGGPVTYAIADENGLQWFSSSELVGFVKPPDMNSVVNLDVERMRRREQ